MAEVEWFMETGVETLENWGEYPALLAAGAMIPHGRGELAAATDEESHFVFNDPGWTPNMERWSEFEKRISKRFKEELATYHKQLAELAESRGLIQVPVQYRPEHFIWLALFHCSGWSLEQVREGFGQSVNSRQAIHTAIKSAARLVGLTPRPVKKR